LTGTRPGPSLRGILIWVQPLAIACENGRLAIVTVSLHDRRGVVEIVTVPPGAIRAGEIDSWKPEDAPAAAAEAPTPTTVTAATASRLRNPPLTTPPPRNNLIPLQK
jgi:hypothetical protein